MRKYMFVLVIVALLVPGYLFAEISMPAKKAEEASRMIAKMLLSGRIVVTYNQDTINNPNKGEKGFTAEYFKKKMLEIFYMNSNVIIKDLDPEVQVALQSVISAAVQVVEDHQEKINKKGVEFKGFIPAYFGRMTGTILKEKTGIVIKQTTFTPRNNYNKPDEFELQVLTMFKNEEISAKKGYGKIVDGKYHYMYPLYIKKGCLRCHGYPKGSMDITGHKKEGYGIGDLRGAISVNININ